MVARRFDMRSRVSVRSPAGRAGAGLGDAEAGRGAAGVAGGWAGEAAGAAGGAEAAPLVFSTEYAHDTYLRVTTKNGEAIDLPLEVDVAVSFHAHEDIMPTPGANRYTHEP